MTAPRLEILDASVKERLNSITFGLGAGEIVALVGPNGAGKSTLLHLAAGDVAADSGRIKLLNKPIDDWGVKALAERRAMLPQFSESVFAFTVAELVGMAAYAGARSADIDEAKRMFELDRLWNKPLDRISGGERQLAHIARVLAQVWRQEDALILLDEPANHLDWRHTLVLSRVLRARVGRGQAVLAALHDLQLAAQLADRVAVMANGQILACGKPEESMRPEVLEAAYGVPMVVQRWQGHWLVSATHGSGRGGDMDKSLRERLTPAPPPVVKGHGSRPPLRR